MIYLKRIRAISNGINALIVHERDRRSVMKKVCGIAVENGGVRLIMIALIDLQGFRNVNETLGRVVGNALLRQVGVWLTSKVRETNLVSRVGVDHFAVFLPEIASQRVLTAFLENLVTDFVNHTFILNKTEFRIAMRVGEFLYSEAGTDEKTLLMHAEAALKKAKSSDSCYLLHTRKMSDAVVGKLTLECHRRKALDKDQFVLFYLPKMHLASGCIAGVEALIRWNDPLNGLVMPDQFIDIMEETGMIREVGRWALRKAIADHLRWRSAGSTCVRIAVNVSPLQLRNAAFVAGVQRAIGIDGNAAAGLEFEMTESLNRVCCAC